MKYRCHVKKGDTVEVSTGEDAGKQGRVLEVYPKRERALVEGLNLIKKHMRKTQDNPQGGVVDKEAPLHVSNLKVVERKS
ncbi:50S ribosomal protein L24 [Kiritimatiella glycovorans]|uniref:Large ribosomal subunit protein uL24 n=1 Tax=Kiritimatiella glycovorans TaxID=1307763 RepID=A0A0G3EEP3_9BACT|nr:50S ribosomal protein L24 [Kiritimatiella glycovorans]AKJ64946.1 50S ribosomal protein L24 [Kiritimatiella glycovorans]